MTPFIDTIIRLTIAFGLLVNCRGAKAAVPCPTNCTCAPDDRQTLVPNAYKVACDDQHLKIMPPSSDFPPFVTTLSMSRNLIPRIDIVDTFPNLLALDLSSNKIETIEPKAFAAVPKLQSLNLGYNNVKDLPVSAFDGLASLKELNLEHNSIRKLRDDVFQNLTLLEIVNFRGNQIRTIGEGIFKHTLRLWHLNLATNRLHNLPDNLFHENGNLNRVDISENQFSKVPIDTLRGAENLAELDISANLMRNLDQYSFAGLNQLQVLSINSMKRLRAIEAFTFSGFCKLRRLQVTNNPFLSTLDDNAFFEPAYNRSCFALEDVDLHGNQLATLMFHTLRVCEIAKVDLRDNQWRCDCMFRWVKTCRKEDPIHQQIT